MSIGGVALTSEAKEVLRAAGVPLHYTQIHEALNKKGVTINGKEPDATLLAALGRADGIEAVGHRSGFYKLHGGGGDLLDKARWIVSLYSHDKWMPAAAGVDLAAAVESYFQEGA